MLVVDLAPLGGDGAVRERTYTDNVSLRGVRLHTTRRWQPGEQAEVIAVQGETPMRGEVVYCQREQGKFFVGLRVRQNRLAWSVLERYGTPS